MEYLERIIYMTPEAIKQHFGYESELGSEVGQFIANADNETLEKIGDCAYWDDRIWEVFNVVMLDAATYIYKKSKEGVK